MIFFGSLLALGSHPWIGNPVSVQRSSVDVFPRIFSFVDMTLPAFRVRN